jgi:hypothetical protein
MHTPAFTKRGLIFKADGQHPWMLSHAQAPVVDPIGGGVLRIYFGTRDSQNRTTISFVEVAEDDPTNLLRLHTEPVLGLGDPGCFDDRGVMPACIVALGGRKFLYYSGFTADPAVPYRLAIGVAVSSDGGMSFTRVGPDPILDRTVAEPHLCAAPFVLPGSVWRMWYSAGLGWIPGEQGPEPLYDLRYSESTDGIQWSRPGRLCLDLKEGEGGIAKPVVVPDEGCYRMWFCYRGQLGFRSDRAAAYKIGYAESPDGLHWDRQDERSGIVLSAEGWDSEMAAYPNILRRGNRLYLFYNGNGFGRSGFGYALGDIRDWRAS